MTGAAGWPFLVARGRHRGYCPVAAPEFLVAAGDYGVLDAAVPDDAGPASVTVPTSLGPVTLVYTTDRVTDADVRGARDDHGRPLLLIYGLACPGSWTLPAATDPGARPPAGLAADLAAARVTALGAYREFLAAEDGFPPVPTAPVPLTAQLTPANAPSSPAPARPLRPSQAPAHPAPPHQAPAGPAPARPVRPHRAPAGQAPAGSAPSSPAPTRPRGPRPVRPARRAWPVVALAAVTAAAAAAVLVAARSGPPPLTPPPTPTCQPATTVARPTAPLTRLTPAPTHPARPPKPSTEAGCRTPKPPR